MPDKERCPVCGYDLSRDAARYPSLVRLRRERVFRCNPEKTAPVPREMDHLVTRLRLLDNENRRLIDQHRADERRIAELEGIIARLQAEQKQRGSDVQWVEEELARLRAEVLARSASSRPIAQPPLKPMQKPADLPAPAADETLWELDGSGALCLKKGAAAPEVLTVPQTFAGQPVTRLGFNALRESGTVRRIFIPEGVQELGNYCFDHCTKLEEVKLPSTLRVIGKCAFWRNSSLRSISLPEGLEAIEEKTFEDCENLKEIELPDSLMHLGKSAFSQWRLQRAVLPRSWRNRQQEIADAGIRCPVEFR